MEVGQGELSSISEDFVEKGYFHGIWVQGMKWSTNNRHYFYHSEILPDPPYFYLIDPTSTEFLNLVTIDNQSEFPLCEFNKAAGIGFLQITDALSDGDKGVVVAIMGDWSLVNENKDGWAVSEIIRNRVDKQKVINAIDSKLQGAFDVRFLGQQTLVDNTTSQEVGFIPINVGQIHIESMPDGTPGYGLEDTVYLSSVAFTPSKQFGFPQVGRNTWTYSLFNFGNYQPDITDLSSIDLSSYDVLVRHKEHHPDWQRNPVTENQCSAVLEYMSLKELVNSGVTVDSEENSISSIQHYENDGSLQIYNFDKNETKEYSDISASANYDIMLRHNIQGNEGVPREVAYTPLSVMIAKVAPRGDCDAGVGYYSIQKYLDGNSNPYLGFYNFQQAGKDRTLNITLSYDGTARYIHTSGHSGDSPDPDLEFITRNNNGQPHVSYDAITITAPKVPASQVSGLTEEISSIVQTVDLSTNVISVLQNNPQVEPILSAKLSSDFWIVGGTYNKNCYGQSIGDSNKILTISLNGRSLYGMGTGLSLDWDNRRAYDENGHVAISWRDTGLDAKCLIHRQGTPSVDWQNMNLMGRLNGTTVAWEDRQLKGGWSVVAGTNPGGTASLNVGGKLTISNNGTLTIGNTTLTEAQLQQLLRLI